MPRPKTLITVTIDSIEPMKVHVPPTVRRHKNTKLVTFRHQNKQYSNVEVCCFIFYPPISNSLIPSDPNFSETSHIAIKPALLLLFQRNLPGTRIHDLWDVPGGGPKPGEPTVLHAVARNTFETTRLRTKSIPREVGYGEKFKFRELQFFKWNFMVEVEELAYNGETGEYPGLADVRIEFDRDEHQMFVWASEQEIKDDKYAAVTPKQKELMLLAFRLRRDDEEELRNVAIQQEELEEEKKALAVRREQKRKEQRTALAATALTVKARKLFPDDYATGPEKHDNDGNEDRNADHEDEDDNYRKVQWQRRPRLWLREDRPDILVGRSAKSDVKTQDDNKEDNKKADKDAEEGGKEEGGEEEDDKWPQNILVYRPPSGNRPPLWKCDPKADKKVRRRAHSDVKTKDDDKKDNNGQDQGRGPQAGRFGLKRHREDDGDDKEQGGGRGPAVGQWNISTGKLVRKGRR